MHDLITLVADRNTLFAVKGILASPQKLGTRAFDAPEPVVHPKRDPGVFGTCHSFLREFRGYARFAVVICDREGCGREGQTRETPEADIEARLASNGWAGRSAAVVIDPELEAWVWSDSPHVLTALGWKRDRPALLGWLEASGFSESGSAKPAKPKEAVEGLLRLAGKPRSSAFYFDLAQKVSFQRCSDAAFSKLTNVLRGWFPV
jgi:hypothetical protein